MKFTSEKIDALRFEVGKRLSEKRFSHTLGVERMSVKIGEKCLPDRIDELRAAALLHDISKEYYEAETENILKNNNMTLSSEDLKSPAIIHSITAPLAVMADFSEFGTDDILSAVCNHTVGSADMSVFDEIILLADYIEDGRKYIACTELRDKFLGELESCSTPDEAVYYLHLAVVISLENTIRALESRGDAVHSRTLRTREAISAKTER